LFNQRDHAAPERAEIQRALEKKSCAQHPAAKKEHLANVRIPARGLDPTKQKKKIVA